ncbi:FKBP-type peptidyl-prolyl cis-trans isomerase [Mariniflexile ostreae]|uniref:Peptidyl-prolyl cis-trans isomerase n=1 Tax=Mariniflexile ostreae TaxID=1520892 RepID=A0ABV5FE86_9FLAO
MKNIILLAFVFIFLNSCAKNDDPIAYEPIDYRAVNDEAIQAYIAEKELDAQKSDSGLYYVINELGDNKQPIGTDDVTVAYKGYFLNGTVFDQSKSEGVSFNLQKVIKGWTEGIPYFKEGGKGILLIPSHLGYGDRYYNGIPGGSVLVFNINLISVN